MILISHRGNINGKFESYENEPNYIDKAILESISVGDMHNAFPKMIDWTIWNQVNAKSHACKSFINNKKAA